MGLLPKIDENNIVTAVYVVNDNEQPESVTRWAPPAIGMVYVPEYDLYTFSDKPVDPNNLSRWFVLPNGTCLADMWRNASTLFTGLIVSTYFPDKVRSLIPNKPKPEGTSYAIIRDPIDRFISSYARQDKSTNTYMAVDDFIEWLINQDPKTLQTYFRPQTLLSQGCENYFDFAKDLTPLAVALGLTTPLQVVNETDPTTKPVLTDEQISKLKSYYADDIALYKKVQAQA